MEVRGGRLFNNLEVHQILSIGHRHLRGHPTPQLLGLQQIILKEVRPDHYEQQETILHHHLRCDSPDLCRLYPPLQYFGYSFIRKEV